MALPCGHAAPAAGCKWCALLAAAKAAAPRPSPARPAAPAPDRPAWCASLGERLEYRAGCASGFRCRHACTSTREDVRVRLGGVMQAVPAEDCGGCPGFHVRHPGSVTPADLALIPVPPRQSDRCVLTLAHGPKGRELLAVSGPTMERYAARVGADFRVIEPPDAHPLWFMAWKFAARQFVAAYDRVFWVDADALIADHCRDVFEFVPRTHVAMYPDLADVGRGGHGYAWLYAETEAIQRSQGLPLAPLRDYRNSGVWVASRGHAAAWDPPPEPLPVGPGGVPVHCAEQHWHQMQVERLGLPVLDLPASLNAQYWSVGRWDPAGFAAAEVRHWAGIKAHDRRVRLMREAAGVA